MNRYDALGGQAAITALVIDLSRRLEADPLLGPLFGDAEHDALQRHRVDYLTAVLGGPEQYAGQSMREAHRALHLTDLHMDRFLERAAESLDALGVSAEASREVIELFERLRTAIVDPLSE